MTIIKKARRSQYERIRQLSQAIKSSYEYERIYTESLEKKKEARQIAEDKLTKLLSMTEEEYKANPI